MEIINKESINPNKYQNCNDISTQTQNEHLPAYLSNRKNSVHVPVSKKNNNDPYVQNLIMGDMKRGSGFISQMGSSQDTHLQKRNF